MSMDIDKFKNNLHFQTTEIFTASGQRTIFVELITYYAADDGRSIFSQDPQEL